MKPHELRQLDHAELQSRLQQVQTEYLHTRDQIRTGKEANHARLKGMRRDIARINTLLRQQPVA